MATIQLLNRMNRHELVRESRQFYLFQHLSSTKTLSDRTSAYLLNIVDVYHTDTFVFGCKKLKWRLIFKE